MGWLRLVGSLKLQVSFAKEPYKRDYVLQKIPIILRRLLIVATPYQKSWVLVDKKIWGFFDSAPEESILLWYTTFYSAICKNDPCTNKLRVVLVFIGSILDVGLAVVHCRVCKDIYDIHVLHCCPVASQGLTSISYRISHIAGTKSNASH